MLKAHSSLLSFNTEQLGLLPWPLFLRAEWEVLLREHCCSTQLPHLGLTVALRGKATAQQLGRGTRVSSLQDLPPFDRLTSPEALGPGRPAGSYLSSAHWVTFCWAVWLL